jgi:hypothetical protein
METLDLGDIIRSMFSFGASIGVQIACAAIAAGIFAYKGKSWMGGAALGFFLGPLGVFIAFVSGPWPNQSQNRPAPAPPPAPMSGSPPRPTNVYTAPPDRVEHRFPDRCPSCNGPVHKRTSTDSSVQCSYCGANIEGTPI